MLHQIKRTVVLMIYPKFPRSFWDFEAAVKMLGLGATMPPTCLATVAAMLPEEYFEVLPIIDLNLETLSDEDIKRADIVMLSAMIVQKESLEETVFRIKRFGKMVVIGGPYATSYRDSVASMGDENLILILNEAEITLSSFIEDWLIGRTQPIYDEHSVRFRSTVALTSEGKPVITGTPIPRWDLLKIGRYASMSVQFSRGCPFNCEFCDITLLYGHIPRTKTPAQLIAELEALRLLGWRGSVFIVDDNFIGNRAGVRDLLPELIKWQVQHDYPFSFFTEASLDLANDDLKDIREGMVMSGFDKVFCGIESTNPEVLKKMGKNQNRGDISEKVRILQIDGLEVIAGFIIGSDSDLPTVFDDIFKFIQSEGIIIAMVGLLTALRGTALYKRLQTEGRLRAESSGNNTHQLSLNFIPKIDEKILIDGYIGLLDRLYLPRNYYNRCRTLRKRQVRFSRHSAPLNLSRILAAFKIFYHNIIKHPDWEFIKFIFGTLFTALSKWLIYLPISIEQAVKLVHFHGITEETVRVHRYPKLVAALAGLFEKQVNKLCGNVQKRLRKLAKLEKKIIVRATNLYNSLDPNFRDETEKVLRDWLQNLITCANKYRQIWQNKGTTK